jgi:hypothetical protein
MSALYLFLKEHLYGTRTQLFKFHQFHLHAVLASFLLLCPWEWVISIEKLFFHRFKNQDKRDTYTIMRSSVESLTAFLAVEFWIEEVKLNQFSTTQPC